MQRKQYHRTLSLLLFTIQVLGQPAFEPQRLVSIPGENMSFEVSWDYFDNETPLFMCWENRSNSGGFSIYRMNIWPTPGIPEIMASSNDSLLNPDINSQGDLVWQAKDNGSWILQYYSELNEMTVTLADEGQNSTQPTLANSILVYIQDSVLTYFNLYNFDYGLIDTGMISNPDLSPDAQTGYWRVAYEKQIQDTTSIFIATKRNGNPPFEISKYSTAMTNKYPRFGTMGGIVYQTLEDDLWNVVIEDWGFVHVENATKPALLTLPIPVARVVEDWLVFYESDSIEGNSEIYAYGFSGTDLATNISNLPGNDFNPECSILSFDTVAVYWEHEVEGGREIWWAKDSLHIQGGSVDGALSTPTNFNINNAYPNPFNSNISVNYTINAGTEINISIFDLNGGLITQTLINKNMGRHTYQWDGTNVDGLQVSSGVYVIMFKDLHQSLSRKIVLLK